MTSHPIFDMSTAQPISSAATPNSNSKPLFDMSKAQPISTAGSGSGMSDDEIKGSVIDALGNTQLVQGGQMGVGLMKGVADTAYGLGKMIPVVKDMLPATEPSYLKSSNAQQTAGKIGENIGEFAAGDAALEGLAKLAKVPEAVLALAEKYPTAAKLLHAAVKATQGAAVGGAQGAVKGSAEGDTAGGAKAGAIGGGIGGAIGGGVESAAMGGNPVDSLTRAVRPTGKLAEGFADKAKLALPRLAAEHAKIPIVNLDDLSEAAHTAASNLWTKEVIPQIQRHANEVIAGDSVAKAIRGGVSAGDKDLFPESVNAADEFAKKFDGNMTLQQAADRMQSLNRKLSSLYKLDPASRYAATANNPTVEAMEDGANELRELINQKLESVGETDPAGLRKTYGALKTVERTAEKRAVVYGRQAPINLAQQLATIGGVGHAAAALLTGNPASAVAGVAPMIAAKATKVLNSPEHLIGESLAEKGIGSRLAGLAGNAGANIGSQVGQTAAQPNTEDEQ